MPCKNTLNAGVFQADRGKPALLWRIQNQYGAYLPAGETFILTHRERP